MQPKFRSDEIYLLFGKSKSGKTKLGEFFAFNFKNVVVYETLLKPKNYLNLQNLKQTRNIADIALATQTKEGGSIPFYPKVKFYPVQLTDDAFDQFVNALFKRRDSFVIIEEASLIFPNNKKPTQVAQGFLRAGGHDWALGQAYLTQRIGDLNKLLLVQLNHAFFFRTNISNDLDYIQDNFGERTAEIIANLKHVDDSTNPEDHEFLYAKDMLPVAKGYLDGNALKFTEMIDSDSNQEKEEEIEIVQDEKIEDSSVRPMPKAIQHSPRPERPQAKET